MDSEPDAINSNNDQESVSQFNETERPSHAADSSRPTPPSLDQVSVSYILRILGKLFPSKETLSLPTDQRIPSLSHPGTDTCATAAKEKFGHLNLSVPR